MQRMDDGLAFLLRYENVAWYENGKVKILDRRIYPKEIKFVICETYLEVKEAIANMVTQSAGPYTAAGMGMALAAYQAKNLNKNEKIKFLEEAAYSISTARPTTMNRMRIITDSCLRVAKDAIYNNQEPIDAIFNRTFASLERRYKRMSIVAKNLVNLFPQKAKILTQCFGETIVGCMAREIRNQDKDIEFFCAETRPYLQGARLTASVLKEQGFKTTVITDNMIAWTILQKDINIFTSAADSICMDGNIVNKVGTFQIALLCKHFGIPYFVTGIPDMNKFRDNIVIEERNEEEVLSLNGQKHTLNGVRAYYPAFDITPPHLVDGVVTDKEIFSPYNLSDYFKTDTEEYY